MHIGFELTIQLLVIFDNCWGYVSRCAHYRIVCNSEKVQETNEEGLDYGTSLPWHNQV